MGVIPSIITVLAFVIYAKSYKLDSNYMEKITEQLKEKNKENH
jgi:melibiose permease